MDPWDSHQYRRRDLCHPSFSSTLLDQIYRSTDDSSDVPMRKKQNRTAASLDENRVCLEKILLNRRKTADDSVVNRRKTADDFVRSRNPIAVEPVYFKHSSSSSSSDSSGFSSSESDSFYRRTRSSPAIHHPKPVRTAVERLERPNSKVKSKALKMYSDLKKVKQPISPGGRLATFLNSLFTGNNTKKPNKTNTATSSSTTCSSASSFSRSCLSKTTSSSEKTKRSVRFCPVNVVILDDEDSARRHREGLVIEENRRVIEAAKELIRTYRENKDVVDISVEEEDDDEDDAASCASSDLFELDNLSSIGIDRYREELPVYETTRLTTNRIISR